MGYAPNLSLPEHLPLGEPGNLRYRYFVTDWEKQLWQALGELEFAASAGPHSPAKPDLRALFCRIDELAGRAPRETEPVLRHYLAKKSYHKARLHLEGREAENAAGNCRHV